MWVQDPFCVALRVNAAQKMISSLDDNDTHVNRPPFDVIICCSCRFDSFGPVEPLIYMIHPAKMEVRCCQSSLRG